ncbi:MAG: hypothetical protein SPE76_09820 [Treponema porcinum]|nr:hypothetical protein [uncultured Treponema sp.]MDY4468880.1 hypothetical protein [Treponema porcinum]
MTLFQAKFLLHPPKNQQGDSVLIIRSAVRAETYENNVITGKHKTFFVFYVPVKTVDPVHINVGQFSAVFAPDMIMFDFHMVEAVSSFRNGNFFDFASLRQLVQIAVYSSPADARILSCDFSKNFVRSGVVMQFLYCIKNN